MQDKMKNIIVYTDWNDINDVALTITTWANATFPDRKPDSSLFKLVMEEIPELLQHKKKHGIEDIGEEFADCLILLLDLAMIWNINLSQALSDKMYKNVERKWALDPSTGFYNHKDSVNE